MLLVYNREVRDAKVDTEMAPVPDNYTLASYILFPLVFGLCSLVLVYLSR